MLLTATDGVWTAHYRMLQATVSKLIRKWKKQIHTCKHTHTYIHMKNLHTCKHTDTHTRCKITICACCCCFSHTFFGSKCLGPSQQQMGVGGTAGVPLRHTSSCSGDGCFRLNVCSHTKWSHTCARKESERKKEREGKTELSEFSGSPQVLLGCPGGAFSFPESCRRD